MPKTNLKQCFSQVFYFAMISHALQGVIATVLMVFLTFFVFFSFVFFRCNADATR